MRDFRQVRTAIRVMMLLAALGIMLAAATPLAAEWQSLGAVTQGALDGNQISFRSPRGLVNISVLAPDLVRVRITSGNSFGPDYSWAVIKPLADWPKATVDFSTQGPDGNERVIRTAELEVHVRLKPFGVAFYDHEGHLISKDDDAHTTAWDGARLRDWRSMPPDEHYFGLGEKAGPLDRRDHTYVMWNTDVYGWGANTDPLYEDVPFFMGLRNGRAYGLFFDNTYRSSFDFGVENPNLYSFGAEGGEMNYYFLWGPDPKKVLNRYTELVGRTPLPPLWAMGYHQCRYSYYPDKVVRFIADNFRIRHIPCDAIFLDIHYMDGYRIFTWDKSRFPDPAALTGYLHDQGFHVVTIIDPGVKQDPNYFAYQQGIAGNDFAKLPDGKVFIGKVWPGESAFPDFTWDRVREWWGTLFKGLLADGVNGIWNDMNEPSVFEVPSKTMPDDVVFYDNGLQSPETKIHNVYGMQMSRATREGLLKLKPNERPLVITRATYAGGQRYSAVWTGDNTSTWDHLRISVSEIMGMGLSGIALAGADIGGFAGGGATPELYTRWLEAGVFYPYCRTHVEYGAPSQEPWSYGDRLEDINRRSIELRYRLLPYLYNAYRETSETGLPVMRALLLDYPDDPEAVDQNSEFLFGDDLLVAPVLRSEWRRRDVYLPKGDWYDFSNDRRYRGPAHLEVDAPLDRIPIFVRGGAIVPTRPVVQYVSQSPIDPLTFDIYPAARSRTAAAAPSSSRDYYEDDGISFDFQRGVSLEEKISVESSADAVAVHMSARQGSYTPPARALVFKIHAQRQAPSNVTADGQALEQKASMEALEKAGSGWAYVQDRNELAVKISDSGHGTAIRAALSTH
ncbi:MAG TPA: glycoside hydrolase family 31 protein [Terriglobia bacterium]|nr:glycoside hydrolase family 31 protein [Terriglobia bacterium]